MFNPVWRFAGSGFLFGATKRPTPLFFSGKILNAPKFVNAGGKLVEQFRHLFVTGHPVRFFAVPYFARLRDIGVAPFSRNGKWIFRVLIIRRVCLKVFLHFAFREVEQGVNLCHIARKVTRNFHLIKYFFYFRRKVARKVARYKRSLLYLWRN